MLQHYQRSSSELSVLVAPSRSLTNRWLWVRNLPQKLSRLALLVCQMKAPASSVKRPVGYCQYRDWLLGAVLSVKSIAMPEWAKAK